jgi:hypothetical protein
MSCRLDLVRPDVSEERIASIIRVTIIGELCISSQRSSLKPDLRSKYFRVQHQTLRRVHQRGLRQVPNMHIAMALVCVLLSRAHRICK